MYIFSVLHTNHGYLIRRFLNKGCARMLLTYLISCSFLSEKTWLIRCKQMPWNAKENINEELSYIIKHSTNLVADPVILSGSWSLFFCSNDCFFPASPRCGDLKQQVGQVTKKVIHYSPYQKIVSSSFQIYQNLYGPSANHFYKVTIPWFIY